MRLVSPRLWILALAAIGLGLSAQPAKANWIFSSGGLSASADFTVVSGTLTVTLKNTASVSPNDPASVLSALFFNYSGSGSISFTPLGMGHTAALASGSANYSGTYNGFAKDIGGEWAFKSGVNGFNYGLSSTGLNLFGPGDRFNNNDLSPPAEPDGIQWGIVNSGYVDGSGNGGINGEGFVRDTATFKFAVSSGFDPTKITAVQFLYGTALGEGGGGGTPHDVVTPAPAGLILLVSGLPVLALRRVLRRKPVTA